MIVDTEFLPIFRKFQSFLSLLNKQIPILRLAKLIQILLIKILIKHRHSGPSKKVQMLQQLLTLQIRVIL